MLSISLLDFKAIVNEMHFIDSECKLLINIKDDNITIKLIYKDSNISSTIIDNVVAIYGDETIMVDYDKLKRGIDPLIDGLLYIKLIDEIVHFTVKGTIAMSLTLTNDVDDDYINDIIAPNDCLCIEGDIMKKMLSFFETECTLTHETSILTLKHDNLCIKIGTKDIIDINAITLRSDLVRTFLRSTNPSTVYIKDNYPIVVSRKTSHGMVNFYSSFIE
jgi:hypothetical protein